jgi:uncharacterized protein YbgA (DUF1722 family)/uncharacterized protein YbbK (DUF523 family)
MPQEIKMGISACLLGEHVRYDGGHKLDRFLRDTFGQYVAFVSVCPEVECGLPTPRESMHLVGDPADPHLVTTRTGIDHTDRMKQWSRKRLDDLAKEELCGFIFKRNSPSSGMTGVKIYTDAGKQAHQGSGLFASAFMSYFPLIPVEDEGRLHDPRLRENFIERVFALQRWRKLLKERRAPGRLTAFHAREKLLLLSHSPQHSRALGKLIAGGKQNPDDLHRTYEQLFMQTLALKSTIAKHVNVLQHILGYFKKNLSADEKQEMLSIIGWYRAGDVPLIVPVTLLNHYVRKYEQAYLAQQTYLNPHPVALQLRNHV